MARPGRGEEKQWFFDKVCQLAEMVRLMPKTYEQADKGDEALAYLHYFAGGQASWWITEKDASGDDGNGQAQAYGLGDLFGDGGELGYISIPEILENGGELDLHFQPKTLGQIREKSAVTAGFVSDEAWSQ